MKKLFLSTLIILAFFPSIFLTSAFAEEATPDTPISTEYVSQTPGLDAETESQIKHDVINTYLPGSNYTTEDILLEYFGTIRGDFKVVRFSFSGMQVPTVIWKKEMGNYIYQVDGTEEVYLYKDHNFYSIINAYENGLIGDEQVEELAQILPYFSELEQSSTSLVEEKSKPVEAKKISSPDTTVNKNNSNGAVQTGPNTYSVIALAVIALLSFTAFSQLSKQRNK